MLPLTSFPSAVSISVSRDSLREYDQLINERRNGRVFIGLREGPFWTFKCTYKYVLGDIDKHKCGHFFLVCHRPILRTYSVV
jgi:hypothetical protein